MPRKLCTVLPLLVVVLGRPAAAQLPEELPSFWDPDGPPIWLTVQRATNARGELAFDKFYRDHHSSLVPSVPPHIRDKRVSESPDDFPCIITTTPLFESGPRPHTSLRDLVSEAELIFTATIGEHEVGFFDGRPVTLFDLEELEILKASPRYDREQLYLSYPQARFWIGEQGFCNERRSLPDSLSPGDGVLVFAYFPPKDLGGRVVEVHGFDFVSGGSCRLSLPFTLKDDPDLRGVESLEDAVWVTRSLVSSGRETTG